jgi:hypothetical protein
MVGDTSGRRCRARHADCYSRIATLSRASTGAVAAQAKAAVAIRLNGRANERAFAKAIPIHLERHHRRPLLNARPHGDLKGNPSLFT